ncbi:hypothetical protein BD413DRAFT_302471 [Trametes elegans]|nr:hypothetical protein BD413DRAFT_302471 [Trametes elegans]
MDAVHSRTRNLRLDQCKEQERHATSTAAHSCTRTARTFSTFSSRTFSVLCNMSKGVYVRQDTLRVGLTTGQPATVYHALALRITWSCSANFAMPSHEWEDEVVHAPWAGDRFCLITRLEMMPMLPKEMGWRDVTR